MQKLNLAATLLAVAIASPSFAQTVQDRTDPQNPKQVTPASPANQGATNSPKDQSATTADQPQNGKAHKKSEHHKPSSDTSG